MILGVNPPVAFDPRTTPSGLYELMAARYQQRIGGAGVVHVLGVAFASIFSIDTQRHGEEKISKAKKRNKAKEQTNKRTKKATQQMQR